MSPLGLLAGALAWLGRQGTRAVAASVFLGLAVPGLPSLLKPYVPEAVFVLICLAFLRVDPARLRAYFVRPRLILLATAWHMIAVPVCLGCLLLALGLDTRLPGVFLALMFQAVSAPIMSAPAFAALMGLDAALSLATLVVCTAIMPLTTPLYAMLFIGPILTLSPWMLGLRLVALLAGAALAAMVIRRIAGNAWIERQRERIDGVSVIVLFVFAIAVMEGVTERFLAQPGLVLALTGTAFLMALGLTGLTTVVFASIGLRRAFALGLAVGHRNMATMIAATGGIVPDQTWLYFGLSQFPIYLVPQLLKPLADRLPRETPRAATPLSGKG